GAQPDDRAAASAHGHRIVRALARRQAFVRAHHGGDPALAGAAVRHADSLHLRAGGRALAAAAVLLGGMKLPRIGITMGDAAGVGPEVVLKALKHLDVYAL